MCVDSATVNGNHPLTPDKDSFRLFRRHCILGQPEERSQKTVWRTNESKIVRHSDNSSACIPRTGRCLKSGTHDGFIPTSRGHNTGIFFTVWIFFSVFHLSLMDFFRYVHWACINYMQLHCFVWPIYVFFFGFFGSLFSLEARVAFVFGESTGQMSSKISSHFVVRVGVICLEGGKMM